MDKVHEHRVIVRQVLTDYCQLYSQSNSSDVETVLLSDRSQDQYLLIRLGWEGDRRVNRTVIYVRLREGKIWVEEDWTEEGVATDLLALGVQREAIVLAFHPPHLREHTEFAVA
jgi:hypothetical protein